MNASMGMHMGSGSSRYDIKGTSGSFDAGYKDGASSFHGVCDNLDMLAGAFPLREGYFGRATRPNNSRVRIIESESPLETAREFYTSISYGGIEESLPGSAGVRSTMADGTIITFREASCSDGSPAIDINVKESVDTGGIKRQKIHFTSSRQEEAY